MKLEAVSKKTLNRLPLYLAYLKSLPISVENISATDIANALKRGDVQVRKDLAQITHAGRRRIGRNRLQLIQDIETYLEYIANSSTIVIGTGKLGQVLLEYDGFVEAGLNVLAGFDFLLTDVQTQRRKPVYHLNQLESFCRCYKVHVGIIAVPDEMTQMVCDRLVACGVKVIWNYTHAQLKVPSDVALKNEKLSISLISRLMNCEM